jgi:hypothetical protein
MERKINRMPSVWEDRFLALMAVNDKLVLGGSVALHILDIIKYNFKERTPDLDFSLTEAFTEDEFSTLIDFFDLSTQRSASDYEVTDGMPKPINIPDTLKKELILLETAFPIHVSISEEVWDEYKEKHYKVDFFNKDYLEKRDWFELDYFGTPIKLTHPSIIFAAKMKYATDSRVGRQYKHFQDIQNINWDNYFPIVKSIQPHYSIDALTKDKNGNYTYALEKYIFDIKQTDIVDINDKLPF